MGQIFDYPNLIAALDAAEGWTHQGYTFMDKDQNETLFTFDQLRSEAMRRAAHLRKQGLKKGDRLGMVVVDGQDFVPTFFAAVWAGIIPVPLYAPMALGKLDSYLDTLVAILTKAEASHVVTVSRLEQVLWGGLNRVPGLKGVINAEHLRGPAPEGVSQEPAQVTPDDICFLQFTSGSTSTPKGVAVTHGSLRANCWAIMRDGLRTDPAVDRGVSWLPLYHDMGLIGFVIAPMFHRVNVTFIPTLAFVWNPSIWLETISRVRGTITFAPNFAYALAARRAKSEQLKRWDLSSMIHFGCGAEPINPTTMRAFLDKFAACGLKPSMLLPSYGMAEATLAISFIAPQESLTTDIIDTHSYQEQHRATPAPASALQEKKAQEVVCCGRAFPGHELAVMSEGGQRLGDRAVGELWLKGPSVAAGYFRDPEATKKTFGDGWLRTGDYGYTVDGSVYITGRKKDLIIINGKNYDPQHVEWLVEEIPSIRKGSAVAFSRPAAQSEELVVAVESRTNEAEKLIESIRERVMEHLQLAVVDVAICSPGSLPKTSSGKLQRAKTRQLYLEGTLRDGGRTGARSEKLVVARHVALSLFGRGQHRARRIVQHTMEIRSVSDAVQKIRLAGSFMQDQVVRLLS